MCSNLGVFPRPTKLLWEIYSQPFHSAASSECPTAHKEKMALVTWMCPSLSEGHRSNNFGSCPHASQSRPTIHPSSGCLSLWGQGCHIACGAQPLRKTNCFRFMHFDNQWVQLFTAWKGNTVLDFWHTDVPSVSLWAKLRPRNRPQTFDNHSGG